MMMVIIVVVKVLATFMAEETQKVYLLVLFQKSVKIFDQWLSLIYVDENWIRRTEKLQEQWFIKKRDIRFLFFIVLANHKNLPRIYYFWVGWGGGWVGVKNTQKNIELGCLWQHK